MSEHVGGLYLLHFEPAYQHAQHYLGFAVDIERRVAEHLAGGAKASPLVRAALSAGCAVTLARTWPGLGRTDERRMKQRSHRLRCPTCKQGRSCRATAERARHDRAHAAQLGLAQLGEAFSPAHIARNGANASS